MHPASLLYPEILARPQKKYTLPVKKELLFSKSMLE